MPSKMNTKIEHPNRRIEADREELADRIARAMKRDGTAQPQPGLNLSRSSKLTELVHGFYEPAFCVIAQGAKALLIGVETFRYDPAHYMISTIGLPMTAQVVEASVERPYLGL